MRYGFTVLLVLAGAVGCSNKVEAEGLGYLPTEDIEYSYSLRETTSNGEGRTLTATTVVLSDRGDLCEAARDAGGLDGIEDVFAVQVLALTYGDPSGIDSNSGLGPMLFKPAGHQALVGARVLERSGGETLLDAKSLNFIDLEAVVRGDFNVNSYSGSPNGYSMGGSFSADVRADLSDPETYDSDVDGDGSDDHRSVSGHVEGRFAGAHDCDSIGGN